MLLAAPWIAAAQLKVVVRDPAGDRVPGAAVVLQNGAGRELERGETDAAGEIVFAGSGERVEVSAEGFEPAGENARGRSELNIALRLAAVAAAVEVSAALTPPVAFAAAGAAELAELPSAGLVENLRATPGVNAVRRGGTNIDPVVPGLRSGAERKAPGGKAGRNEQGGAGPPCSRRGYSPGG